MPSARCARRSRRSAREAPGLDTELGAGLITIDEAKRCKAVAVARIREIDLDHAAGSVVSIFAIDPVAVIVLRIIGIILDSERGTAR